MLLAQKDIDELRAIHQRLYKKPLSDDEAWEMGHRLVRLFDVLTRPPRAKADILYAGSNRVAFDRTGGNPAK